MATANDFAVANSYLPPQKPVLGQNELAVWELRNNVWNKADQTHMQWDTPTDSREKKNTSIAGDVTKYSILHTQESFDKKILTLPN